ncbi:MAG: hypothetical protein KC457_28940, partial [Myxococcales bacterium]|nr:hypothetical protein [Myxococcales bacterium]
MLLRPDATYINQATKHAEEVFPRGVDWLNFASKLPGDSVFKNSVLEPALDVAGELSMAAFARADWQNWISTMQIGVFE